MNNSPDFICTNSCNVFVGTYVIIYVIIFVIHQATVVALVVVEGELTVQCVTIIGVNCSGLCHRANCCSRGVIGDLTKCEE